MDRYQFISLDRAKQIRVLKVNGMVIHRKLKRQYTSSIYQLENFYIEVWENGVKGNVLNLITHKDNTLLKYHFNLNQDND